MMNLTLQTAAMMEVTAVEKMLILNSAQNVNANFRRHVLLDITVHWWVTVIATMNSIIQTASIALFMWYYSFFITSFLLLDFYTSS